MAIHRIREDLHLIDIDQALEGFRQFISAWLLNINGEWALVDPGPAATVPCLVDQLKAAGVSRLSRVLLTHIHLDHAGGTGHLLRHYPDALVNCHPKGIPHLTDPARLWEESRNVLGPVAECYGEPAPVPASSISYRTEIEIGGKQLGCIETPGHAPHHVSYVYGDVLVAGEVAGVEVPLEQGSYIRPATPPPFHHGLFRDSILKLEQMNASHVCLGHYGCRRDAKALFENARTQLDSWVCIVRRHAEAGPSFDQDVVLADLLQNDPNMAGWERLPKDIQSRERYFCYNSIRGIHASLRGEQTASRGGR